VHLGSGQGPRAGSAKGEGAPRGTPVAVGSPRVECAKLTACRRRCGRVKRQEVDSGVRDGVTIAEAQRVKELEREVKELRLATRSWSSASAFFGPGGARPPTRVLMDFIDEHRRTHGGRADLQGAAGRPAVRIDDLSRFGNVELFPMAASPV
jgi:transposase